MAKTIFYSIILIALISACSQASQPSSAQVTSIVQIPITVEVTRVVVETTPTHIPPKDVIGTIVAPVPTNQVGNLTGTYSQYWGQDGGCTLNAIHEITLEPFDKIHFELFCTVGAPSYNMGYVIATILETDNIAVYSHNSELANESCNIVFTFLPDGVDVSQLGEDFICGFGHGVYANGTYLLKSRDIPKLGCLNTNPDFNLCR
jgi:hypothetical protein